MSRIRVHGVDIVIAEGAQASTGTIGKAAIKAARAIAIFAPATLAETIRVEVSNDAGSTWKILQSGGSDVTISAAECIIIDSVAYDDLRLYASSGVTAAARTFTTHIVEEF